ncbi:nucleotidyl transferase [bacterium]|nr:nucleotidyl transferase [bacterium]
MILAGGLATRMRPLTDHVPKALLRVGEEPFAHFQLAWLARHGVTDVVYSIAYKGEMIRKFVGDGSRWGLRVTYVDEGNRLLGTGGAIRLAFDKGVLEPQFLMTYGDSFLPIDFLEVWRAFKATSGLALMTVFRNNGSWDKSNALFVDGQVVLYDKFPTKAQAKEMCFIDYGLSAFDRSIIEKEIPPGQKFDLATLLKKLSTDGKLAGLEFKERFYEIGSPQGLQDFTQWVETHSNTKDERGKGQ